MINMIFFFYFCYQLEKYSLFFLQLFNIQTLIFYDYRCKTKIWLTTHTKGGGLRDPVAIFQIFFKDYLNLIVWGDIVLYNFNENCKRGWISKKKIKVKCLICLGPHPQIPGPSLQHTTRKTVNNKEKIIIKKNGSENKTKNVQTSDGDIRTTLKFIINCPRHHFHHFLSAIWVSSSLIIWFRKAMQDVAHA